MEAFSFCAKTPSPQKTAEEPHETFERLQLPPPSSKQWLSLFHDTKTLWFGNLCNTPGINTRLSVKDGHRHMHATQSQESGLHMCYQTETTTGKRPTFAPFFRWSINVSRCSTTRREKKKNPNEYLHHVGEYTQRTGKENTHCVLIVPLSNATSKNKCRDGCASEGSKQIMWREPRVASLLVFLQEM